MAEEEKKGNPSGQPVSEALCDERSKRIEEAVTSSVGSLKDAFTTLDVRIQAVTKDHEHRLNEMKSMLDQHHQLFIDMNKGKEMGYKRAMLWVAVCAVAISFLSNLDKIIAAFK
jgi:hypothetical protein